MFARVQARTIPHRGGTPARGRAGSASRRRAYSGVAAIGTGRSLSGLGASVGRQGRGVADVSSRGYWVTAGAVGDPKLRISAAWHQRDRQRAPVRRLRPHDAGPRVEQGRLVEALAVPNTREDDPYALVVAFASTSSGQHEPAGSVSVGLGVAPSLPPDAHDGIAAVGVWSQALRLASRRADRQVSVGREVLPEVEPSQVDRCRRAAVGRLGVVLGARVDPVV